MRLDELIEEALLTQKQVADETRLSPGTVSRMVNGHPTSRLSVRKVLHLLSQKLGQKIEIEDVEGLNITDDQLASQNGVSGTAFYSNH